MAGRRRGRTGRGWDAAPQRPRPNRSGWSGRAAGQPSEVDGEEFAWPEGAVPAGRRSDGPRTPWGRRTAERDDETPVDPAELAREICLRQLAVRPRTRSELAGALKQRGIDDEVAAEVLERYGEVGIIDDTAFARAWVSSRHHGRGLASRALANELRQKGVDAEAVGTALADLDPETEEATARAMVERKLRSDRGGPPEARLRRLVGMLARKGYPPGLAMKVVREALARRDADEETDLDLDAVADQLETEAAAAHEAEATFDTEAAHG
jgi:regulatory protein